MMATRFVYSTIRFVPDPARGEFVNIGAVIGSDDSKEWQLRTVDNMRRARYLDEGSGVLVQAINYLNDIGRKLDRYTESLHELFLVDYEVSEKWLQDVFERSRNVIQLSPPAPILTDDIETAVEIIFTEFIVDPTVRTPAIETKQRAVSAVKQAYRQYGLLDGHHVTEHATVAGPSFSGQFDFVVANGRAVQLAQAWSFQISDESLIHRVKAWAWNVEDIRDNGGQAILDDRQVSVPREIAIDVIFVPPAGKRSSIYQEARYAFQKVKVDLYEVSGAAHIAAKAKQLLEAKQ